MILLMLYVLAIASILLEIVNPRTLLLLGNSDLYLAATSSESVYGIWVGRIETLIFSLGIIIAIGQGLLYRKGRLPKQGMVFTFAWIMLFVSSVISSIFSVRDDFNYKSLFFPLLLIATYLNPRFNIKEKLNKLLYIPLFFVYTSLFAAIFFPSWAYEPNYTQTRVGLDMRLFGTVSHANGLGAVALSALVLLRVANKKSQANLLHSAASLIALFLSQSKTIWITLLVWLVIEFFTRLYQKKDTIYHVVGYGILLTIFAVSYVLLFQANLMESIFSSSITLTGRTTVWAATYEVWLENPWLGYGPDLWNLEFRQVYGYLWAGQAHNQVFQILGETGILGIFSLIIFYIVLIKVGSKNANLTHGATFGIVLTILLRSFTEVPLRNYLIDANFIVNSVFFIILLNAEASGHRT